MTSQIRKKCEAPTAAQRKMLLNIAADFGAQPLSFIEFANLIVNVLDDAIRPEQISESAKAHTVNVLWKEYIWRSRNR